MMRRAAPSSMRCQASRAAFAAPLLTALLLPRPAMAGPFDDLAPADPARRPAWAEEFKVFDGTPRPLAHLVEGRQQAGTFLVSGARPRGDRPAAEHEPLGKPEPGDWVFEDATAAVRVFGVPPPEPGKAIVLAASFAPGDPPSLRAIRAVAAGNARGPNVVRAGDFIHFSLPATKSFSFHVEFSGDVAAIESLPFPDGVVVRALRPGTVTGKVLARWWNRPEPELRGQFTLEVKPLPPGPKAPDVRWLKELAGAEGVGFTAYPTPLGWQAEHPESYRAPFLVVGTRPEGDRPPAGLKLHGRRRTPGDWVVADASGAIWVSGLPAPEPGGRVLLTGRLSTAGGSTSLEGIRFLVAGDRKAGTRVRAGEFVHFPLPGNKSTTCPVVVEGDAVEVAFTDQRDALIVRAVKPGVARILILSHWFDSDEAIPIGEALVTVR